MKLTHKLLGFIHRVFSKDPLPFLALRLQYNGTMTWAVSDGILTTTVSGGSGTSLAIDLSSYTLTTLVSYLAGQTGYTVLYLDRTPLAQLSALVLMDGTGNPAQSNGDHLYGYTSLLWAYLEAMAVELQALQDQVLAAPAEMAIPSADDMWLDELGSYYAVPRNGLETDSAYGPRIIAEVLRPKSNNVALESALADYYGQKVAVTNIVKWGPASPVLNGVKSLDGSWYLNATATPLYGLFQVTIGFDLEGALDLSTYAADVSARVERLRAGGTHLDSVALTGGVLADVCPGPSADTLSITVTQDSKLDATWALDGSRLLSGHFSWVEAES